KPMMTMLKQGRAFGLGVLLATQNPVDLDYKALSNIGTWWLGRLQTERDKARVLDGLEGAAASNRSGFNRKNMEELLAGLGSRVFLMNNVNDDAPTVFHVRWVMSYLTGPLARGQLKRLMDEKREKIAAIKAAAPTPAAEAPKPAAPRPMRPRLPRGADDFFIPAGAGVPADEINYVPAVIRIGEVRYLDASKGINGSETTAMINKIESESGNIEWSQTLELPDGLTVSQLGKEPVAGATFSELPQPLLDQKLWSSLNKELVDWLYGNHHCTVFKSPLTGLFSRLEESEGDFRARLVHAAHEARDQKVEDLRKTYEKKIKTIEDRLARAMDTVADQKAQASTAKINTAMRIGSTILGAILGKRISSTAGRGAVSGASRAWKESRDVARAKAKVEDYEEELEAIEEDCEREIEALKAAMDPMSESLETIRLTPLKKNCSSRSVGIVWMPYRVNPEPQLGAAW
ncbi:MAG: ATP-binding protein, partial [Verrucomicrobiaceae bacterium]|nr:ATP-binding protein [Verrucomicrobiaceae bacterium]